MRRKRRNHQPAFKAKVALAAVKGDKTLAEIADEFDIHANQVNEWRRQLLDNASGIFSAGADQQKADEKQLKGPACKDRRG